MKANQDNLSQFQWAVDQDGYEPVTVHPESMALAGSSSEPQIEIRRRGGPWREYRPALDKTSIARKFANLPETKEAVLDFVSTYGLPGAWLGDGWPEDEPLEDIFKSIRGLRMLFETLDSRHPKEAIKLFNEHIQPRMTLKLGGRARKPHLEVVPLSLISFMAMQFVNEITWRDMYIQCKQCPTWIRHHMSRQFCSNQCRKTWHRLNPQ